MAYETEVVKTGNLKDDDIIIAFMGPTGCGKSQIIDLLTGQLGKRAGDALQPCTRDVTASRILNHEKYGRHIVLVDTPGFDDVERSDKQILEMISNWLLKTYKRKLTLAGVIYLHRVNDIRMSEAPHRNLRMFGELSGNKSAKKVILATTMWDKVSETEGEKREVALKERYWNVMIHHGAIVERFLNTRESAWAVINRLVERERNKSALLLQEELVDLKKRLIETNAGKALYLDLQVLIEKQNRSICSVEQAKESENDPEAEIDLQALQKILQDADNLKIPLGRRFALFVKSLSQGRK